MSIEGWAMLWTSLLWIGAGAFGLLAVYIGIQYIRGQRNGRST